MSEYRQTLLSFLISSVLILAVAGCGEDKGAKAPAQAPAPWTSIGSAKPFEASGWGEPIVTSEIRAHYDPSSRGEFIELETTAPKTCVRLPMYPIEDARSYLALS